MNYLSCEVVAKRLVKGYIIHAIIVYNKKCILLTLYLEKPAWRGFSNKGGTFLNIIRPYIECHIWHLKYMNYCIGKGLILLCLLILLILLILLHCYICNIIIHLHQCHPHSIHPHPHHDWRMRMTL
jgi:hypothetical protein